MTEIIDRNYTDDQIQRAKVLFDILVFKTRYKNGSHYYMTGWGDKTLEGLLNTILAVMYGNVK